VKKEIWAYGLRNPWRFSFDKETDDLYIGDVGQSAREEIDFQAASSTGGENYGWRVMEGSLCYNPSSGCNQSGKALPVAEYEHPLGCAVTGGYVYRGSKFPILLGQYFYADYCSGRFFSLHNNAGAGWEALQLVDTPYTISTFGEDEQGELYLADYETGKIYNIGYQEGIVTVTIANSNMGSSFVSDQTSIRKSYTGINNGPVRVTSTLPMVASERVAYFPGWGQHLDELLRIDGTAGQPTRHLLYLPLVQQPRSQLPAQVWECRHRHHHRHRHDRRSVQRQLQSGSQCQHTHQLPRSGQGSGQGDQFGERPHHRFPAGGVFRWHRLDQLLRDDGIAFPQTDQQLCLPLVQQHRSQYPTQVRYPVKRFAPPASIAGKEFKYSIHKN
jgi:hypothetical protein